MNKSALSGLRVVEYGAGTGLCYSTRLLADLGAEVIKVEPPAGDFLRGYGPFRKDQPDPEASSYFLYLNAGKRGVTVDLKSAEGRKAFRELLQDADLLVENGFSGAETEKGEWSFPELARDNPRLVMVSLSPFGRTGPYRDYRGYDLNCSAFGGLSIVLGSPGRPPLSIPFDQWEFQLGLHGASAGLTALLARGQTGRGQHVDISLSDIVLFYVRGMFLVTRWGGWKRKGARQLVSVYPTGYFRCKDGFFCIASQTAKQWRKIIKLMGDPEWSKDPAMRDALSLGVQNPDAGDAVLKPWLLNYTRRELMQMAMENEITMGMVNRVDEVVSDRHFAERGTWAEVEHPVLGKVKFPGDAAVFSETPWKISRTSPRLGEHNREILNEKKTWSAPAPDAKAPAGKKLKRPLEGIRVLDFGWNWAGPLATQILADLGAEVIKIETNARQDVCRYLDHLRHFFRQNNRSKLSVSIDIKQPGGVELVRRLARVSDVVLDNFSAGVMERNGLGFPDLRKENPGIICVSMSMGGQTGPLSDMKGFASIATSYAGLEGLIGYRGEDSLGIMGFGYGDANGALHGLFTTLAALYHRGKTGSGQLVDLSQMEAVFSQVGKLVLDYLLNGRVAETMGNFHTEMAPHGIYPAQGEDQWISIVAGNETEWESLCRAAGHPEWQKDGRFQNRESRLKNAPALDELIAGWTKEHPKYHLMELLQKAGVAATPVLGIEDGDADPHFAARGIKEDWKRGGDEEPVAHYTTPWKLSETPAGIDRFTPKLGEHNDYIFRELLKMDEKEIQELVEKKVIN